MNGQFTTTTPDTTLLARWAVQADTGADVFTVAELDRLIALTPANDARALAELDDCRAIEVELLGYDPTATVTPLDCRGDMCVACNGSGEGMRDGTVCAMCNGSGEVGPWPIFDEPYGLDAGDFDDYMVGSYAAAVA